MPNNTLENAKVNKIGLASLLLGGSILLSRILGYLRDALMGNIIGAGELMDTYYAAFQLPDLLNYLMAGSALSIALLPQYTKIRQKSNNISADRFLGIVLGNLGIITVITTILLFVFTPTLIELQFPRFSSSKQQLTIYLTRIVLPAQIFFIIGGILRVPLFARGRFFAVALAPLIYNISIIVVGFLFSNKLGIEAFAWGALLGAFLGPFLITLYDVYPHLHLHIQFNLLDRRFLNYLLIAFPLMLGQSLLTVDEYYSRWFSGLLTDGSLSYIGYARKLMQIPVAVAGQALGAASLPAMTLLWVQKEKNLLNQTLTNTLKKSLSLALFSTAGFFILSKPFITFLFEHGAFKSQDTFIVNKILMIFLLAIPAFVIQQIIVRAFYVRSDTYKPMIISTFISISVIPLYVYGGKYYDIYGIAFASVISININSLCLFCLARYLHGSPLFLELLKHFFHVLLIAIVSAMISFGGLQLLRPFHHLGSSPQFFSLLQLFIGGTLFLVTNIVITFFIGDIQSRNILKNIFDRLKKKKYIQTIKNNLSKKL